MGEYDGDQKREAPTVPAKEEAISIIGWLRWRLFGNSIRIMWREMKIIFFMFGFLIFFQFFFLFIGDLVFTFFLLSLYLSLPLMILDFQRYNIYRFTIFYRSDLNYLYPSLLQKRSLVGNNLRGYTVIHLIGFVFYLMLLPVFLPYSDYSWFEAVVILFNLLLIKFFLFTVLILVETAKRRDIFTDFWDQVYMPVQLLIIFFHILFDFFLLMLIIPESYLPLFPALVTPAAGVIAILSIPTGLLVWKRHISPYIDDYWQEDRIPIPAFFASPAVRNTTIFGEEVRELDRESDLVGRIKFIEEDRFRMKERGVGVRALWEKCTAVFWREQFNLFVSITIPTLLFTGVLVLFVSPLTRDFIIIIVGELLTIVLIFVIASNNPLIQEPYALAITRLLPFQPKRLITWSILQTFLAGIVGFAVFAGIIHLTMGSFTIQQHPETFLILIVSIGASSMLMNVINLHGKHNYYPRQMNRTSAQSLPFFLVYFGIFLVYIILTMFVILEEYRFIEIYIILTGGIIILGPWACLRLYSTMSIH